MPTDSTADGRARTPLSTYRLQFNRDFTFRHALELVNYLDQLGVPDLYASPYLQARPGSSHGYDISDHNRLNPELGDTADHEALTSALRERGMGHLLDIVPNHMGIGGMDNEWWMDVLENGPSSSFASYFDIDWHPLKPDLTDKILLPVLGDQFGNTLERGELRLAFEDGRFRIRYFEHVFPVSPRSSSMVLRAAHGQMAGHLDVDDPCLLEVASVAAALEHLPGRDRTDADSVAERRRESLVTRRRLMRLQAESPPFRDALEAAIEAYNGTPGDSRSFDLLEALLDDQPYRLAFWRVAAEEINYRRFFDINDLAGVRVERPEVFGATHGLILDLVEQGRVTGLRIDHPDGLYHPDGYLLKLQDEVRRRTGQAAYLLVEKILTGEEELPERWPVAGTVGYDFLNRVNALFVAGGNEGAMTGVYERFVDIRVDFERLVYTRKKLILRVALASELNVLAYLINRISEKNRRSRDFTLGSLTDVLRETIASFPVYRTYIDASLGRMDEADAAHVERAIATAIRRNRVISRSIFHFLRDVLLLRWPHDLDAEARAEHAEFVMKFQQLTGPVMAKGVEDTSFYIFNRLVSLNEVGGEPDRFGILPNELHQWVTERARAWPGAMNSSSTHDTKRSEDVRARISVLSEMPDEWEARVHRWSELNGVHREEVEGDVVPDANDEYLIYQTLVGSWPLDADRAEVRASYRERIGRYLEKATREAKEHTSWINPNEEYEAALQAFLRRILDFESGGNAAFLDDFRDFHAEIVRPGMLNSLAQTLLKLMLPGVPDTYQGQELWDFSLVDPDNRRPVDYALRRALLASVQEGLAADRGDLAREAARAWGDGRVKLLVTHVGLRLRREAPDLFLEGEYVPLEVDGEWADHLFAFARHHAGEILVVAVPRLPVTLERASGADLLDPEAWGDTRITAPAELLAGRALRNLFTDTVLQPRSGSERAGMYVGEALDGFPVALWRADTR